MIAPFKMKIADVFDIKGRGIVVVGKIESGSVSIDDVLVLRRDERTDLKVKVVAIEKFKQKGLVSRRKSHLALWTKLALITAIHDGPLVIVKEFDAQKREEKFLLQEEYPLDALDFRTFLANVKARKDIDAIVINVFHGQIGSFSRQARELGIALPHIGLEIHDEDHEWNVADGAMKGDHYVGIGFHDASLESEYRQRFPGDSAYAASLGYDLVAMLAAAANQKHGNLGVYFSAVKDFPGASGLISKDDRNRRVVAPALRSVPY